MKKVFVGKVVNTHGIKGEFRIKSDFDMKANVFAIGKKLIIDDNPYEIVSYRIHKGYDMITVKDFNNINDVIPFKGKNVFINREELELDDNEYILDDLIGAFVICDSKVIGSVVDYTNDLNPLLIISGEKDFYIPIKGNFIIKFEKENNKLYVLDSTKDLII